MRLLAFALLLSGCGFVNAPPMVVATECSGADLHVQVEVGLAVDCNAELQRLASLRALFELRFGQVDPPVIRLRAADVLSNGASASTFGDAIDLARAHELALPHELNHVRLGPSSGDHHGWCADFFPWQEQALGIPLSVWCP